MINIAPLDYERYLALVGPHPLVEAVAQAVPLRHHVEELTQISERMDLWHDYSAEGEVKKIRLAQAAGQSAALPTAMPPVHTGPEPQVAWNTVMETASQMSIGGAALSTPPSSVAADLYRPVVDAKPPSIIETA